jgi:hypothetical protein
VFRTNDHTFAIISNQIFKQQTGITSKNNKQKGMHHSHAHTHHSNNNNNNSKSSSNGHQNSSPTAITANTTNVNDSTGYDAENVNTGDSGTGDKDDAEHNVKSETAGNLYSKDVLFSAFSS